MRISDWSSDVCSSDLICQRRGALSRFRSHGGCRFRSIRSEELAMKIAIGFVIALAAASLAGCVGYGYSGDYGYGGYPNGSYPGDRYPGSNYPGRSEEHTSELQSLMRISYAVFCLK